VQVAALPEPITPQPNGVPPPLGPPVQPPRQNDTLGTGSAPSNPVPQQPSQPAVDVASRPAPIPVNSQPTTTALAAPMRIAPTNSGELAPTIPIQWTPVSGATRYELAVRDLTTNAFVVDQPVYGTSHTAPPYSLGRTFRWTVRACDNSGCGSWSQGWTFRTAGATQTTTNSCDASLTSNQQQTINRYYQLPSANGVTRWTDSTICSMKSRGVLEQRIAEMQAEVDRVKSEDTNWIAFVRSFASGIIDSFTYVGSYHELQRASSPVDYTIALVGLIPGERIAKEGAVSNIRLAKAAAARFDYTAAKSALEAAKRYIDQIKRFKCSLSRPDYYNYRHAQKKFGELFSTEGPYGGQTIDNVAAALKRGTLSPSALPIQYAVRDGITVVLNTRSTQALKRAGVEPSKWSWQNIAGNADAEGRLIRQLENNSLPPTGWAETLR
jgi:hypothetical protein